MANGEKVGVLHLEVEEGASFYAKALVNIAEASGITSKAQLIAMTESASDTYADTLAKHIRKLAESKADLLRAAKEAINALDSISSDGFKLRPYEVARREQLVTAIAKATGRA